MHGPQQVVLFLEVLETLEGRTQLGKAHCEWVLGGLLSPVSPCLALGFLSTMK